MDEKITKFVEQKCVYRGKNDYTFLLHRQWIVAYFILEQLMMTKAKTIGKYGAVNKQTLFHNTKKGYDGFLEQHSKKIKENKLKEAIFTTTLFRLDGIFLTIREHGSKLNKLKGIHTFYEIRITPLGVKLFEYWKERVGGNENEENEQETA